MFQLSGPASEVCSIHVLALSQRMALVHRGLSSEDRAAFYRYSVIAVVISCNVFLNCKGKDGCSLEGEQ